MVTSVTILALAGSAAFAQPTNIHDWANVMSLPPERRLTLTVFGEKQKLKGTFQLADEAGLILHVSGQDIRLDRAAVRRVAYQRSILRSSAPLLGFVAGAFTIGPWLHRHRGADIASPLSELIGGGIGLAIGFLVRSERVIYEAPRKP